MKLLPHNSRPASEHKKKLIHEYSGNKRRLAYIILDSVDERRLVRKRVKCEKQILPFGIFATKMFIQYNLQTFHAPILCFIRDGLISTFLFKECVYLGC